MARINLSIPDELKRRMDREEANWSQIASDAFLSWLNDTDRLRAKKQALIAERERIDEELARLEKEAPSG